MSMTSWYVNRRVLRGLVRDHVVNNGAKILVDNMGPDEGVTSGISYTETGGGACAEGPGRYAPGTDVYVYEIALAVNYFNIDTVFARKISRRFYEDGILVPRGKALEVYARYCIESINAIDLFWGT